MGIFNFLKEVCDPGAISDFNDLVNKADHDDYVFLLYGIKMAEYGMFDLSDKLIDRLDSNHFTGAYVKDMRRYYYPSGMMDKNDNDPQDRS